MSLPVPRTRYDLPAFRLGDVPVTFSPWFLLAVWVVLARSATFAHGLVHLAAVTVSVLVHELGHAVVARAYGLAPAILLHGFGGWCSHREPRTRDQALRVTAGGPAAGLVLAGVAWAVSEMLPASAPWQAHLFAWDLAWMNLALTGVNLLPVLPLDGGTLMLDLLERRRRIARPWHTVRLVGVGVGATAAVLCLLVGQLGLALLFGLLAWDNAAGAGLVRQGPGFGRFPAHAPSPVLGLPGAPWWRPTRGVAGTLVVTGAVVALTLWPAVAEPLAAATRLDDAGWHEPWRWLTWPFAPQGHPFGLVSALAALWLLGPSVERRLRTRGLLVVLAAAWAGTGLAGGVLAALGAPGVLAGPVPLAVGVFAAWAFVAPSVPVGPPGWALPRGVALLLVAAVALGDALGSLDAVGAAGRLAAIGAAGLAVARLTGRPLPHRALIAWWRLRNPPPVDLSTARRRRVGRR